MTIVQGATAPVFNVGGTRFTGLASPSRGARETGAWRVRMAPGTEPVFHHLTREEILVAISGRARVHIDGKAQDLAAGDCAIVSAGTEFALSNPHDEPFEAVAVLPVGGAAVVDGKSFNPPWAA